MKELLAIQQALTVPKNHTNDFGGYNYRSAEDILACLKPLLFENECVIILSDELELHGERYYVIAHATLWKTDGKQIAYCTGCAREALDKKKSDVAQITGGASSYARKYALCGLFGIDDGNDPDSTNKHGKDEQKPPKTLKASHDNPVSTKQLELIKNLFKKSGMDAGDCAAILSADYKVAKAAELNAAQAREFIDFLKGKAGA